MEDYSKQEKAFEIENFYRNTYGTLFWSEQVQKIFTFL